MALLGSKDAEHENGPVDKVSVPVLSMRRGASGGRSRGAPIHIYVGVV